MERKIKVIVIGGSAGSFSIIRKILLALPDSFSIPLVMCFHRLKDRRNGFVESLESCSGMRILEPRDKDIIVPGNAYLAPANYHMLIEPTLTFALSVEEEVNFSRPSIDLTFETAGSAYHDRMLGIIVSGANSDGARGVYNAHKKGAYTVIQDPEEADFATMPREALKLFSPDQVMPVNEIIGLLNTIHNNNGNIPS